MTLGCGGEVYLDLDPDDEDDPGIWRCEECPWDELDVPLPPEALQAIRRLGH